MGMFTHQAGFEVARTDRYSSGKEEVCVRATKQWHTGDEIRLCSGYVARLSPEEEAHLTDVSQRDFSVMFSTRKESNCLFLGPARFVNHDCNSNCKFIPYGANGVCFKAMREIQPTEEITTYYGKDYFGVGNRECECATCEAMDKGAFRPEGDDDSDDDSDAEEGDGREGGDADEDPDRPRVLRKRSPISMGFVAFRLSG